MTSGFDLVRLTGGVKVFISSLIRGQEEYRNAAEEAIAVLGHQAIRAEQFPASAATPQQACLAGVREADVVILILGARYGATQGSGLSATHEEYREARERKPVLVFIEAGVEAEPAQRALIDEVEGWATGHFRASFQRVGQLNAAVIRGLHEHELALSAGSVDENEMLLRARALVPERRGMGTGGELVVALAGGPHQQVLRPAELDHPGLARDLQREALFGDHSVLDASEGTAVSVRGDALFLEQRSASVLLDQAGSVRILRSLSTGDRHRAQLSAIIEEDVIESVGEALRFAGWLLDRGRSDSASHRCPGRRRRSRCQLHGLADASGT